MEVQVTEENGIKKEIFDVQHHDLLLKVINQTKTIQITHPRRKVQVEKSCIVMIGYILLGKYNYHLRPGQINIPELNWLTSSSQLETFYLEDCSKHFMLYCKEPVEFLLKDDNYFVHQMQDPWCWNQFDFSSCIQDFANAYNNCYGSHLDGYQLQKSLFTLEKDWHRAYHSKPTLEELMESGFLITPSLQQPKT